MENRQQDSSSIAFIIILALASLSDIGLKVENTKIVIVLIFY
jgi:hypothetical protein